MCIELDDLAVSISCVFLLFIIRLYLGEVVLTGVCGLSGDGCNLRDGDQSTFLILYSSAGFPAKTIKQNLQVSDFKC